MYSRFFRLPGFSREERVREVVQLGYNAIFLTVDAPFPGNRERDVRAGWEIEDVERLANEGQHKSRKEMPRVHVELEDAEEIDVTGTAGALIANDDVDMTWQKVCVVLLCHFRVLLAHPECSPSFVSMPLDYPMVAQPH